MLLREIRGPSDLKKYGVRELELLCAEIRHEIIGTSLKNGGHIGASLGTVELAVALHRIFESPKNPIVWDVGHQAYAHKLLTGRFDRFSTLRQLNGLSGFLSRAESEHDVYGAGHSSTALSAAMGFAYKNPEWTVAVVGDGSLTAGVAFEALNHLQQFQRGDLGPLLIILNDNQMSISENVGAIPHLLSQGLAANFFGAFDVDTIGPVNGHDLSQLLATLNGIHETRPERPLLLHVLTQKGKGYGPAEVRPATFHGVSPVQASNATRMEKVPGPNEAKTHSWSEVFGKAAIRLAEKNPRVVAVTAAMSEGTGLVEFGDRFQDRFFDVGIAEPHAVTFAAGLAASGWRPLVAIYSTFLQRGFDALIHDVALQNLPVTFCVDRAGLVGADGPTHHGAFDLAYASMVPGLTVYAPEFDEELFEILEEASLLPGPSLIRYPRGKAPHRSGSANGLRWERIGSESAPELLVAIGSSGARARSVWAEIEKTDPGRLQVLVLTQVKPLPPGVLEILKAHPGKIHSLEDGVIRGGIGESLATAAGRTIRHFGYPDAFVPHGTVEELDRLLKLDTASLAKAILTP